MGDECVCVVVENTSTCSTQEENWAATVKMEPLDRGYRFFRPEMKWGAKAMAVFNDSVNALIFHAIAEFAFTTLFRENPQNQVSNITLTTR